MNIFIFFSWIWQRLLRLSVCEWPSNERFHARVMDSSRASIWTITYIRHCIMSSTMPRFHIRREGVDGRITWHRLRRGSPQHQAIIQEVLASGNSREILLLPIAMYSGELANIGQSTRSLQRTLESSSSTSAERLTISRPLMCFAEVSTPGTSDNSSTSAMTQWERHQTGGLHELRPNTNHEYRFDWE